MSSLILSLKLDANSLSNKGELLLVDVRPTKKYIDGKQSDEYEYKCSVVAPQNGYNKYDITVSDKPAFEVHDGAPVSVSFNELIVKLYRKYNDNEGYGLSCKAKSVVPVKKA